jgi:RNA-directed DNA polymerase
MKESYGEGLASHTGPESWACRRKAADQALTGVHAGQPLSSEISPPGRRRRMRKRKATSDAAISESCSGPAESKTLRMRGNSLHGNREIPSAPMAELSGGPVGESPKAYTSDMHADGKSDGPIVPEKPPNKDGPESSAEAVEERGPTKGNTSRTAVARTQRRSATLVRPCGVRGAAGGNWPISIFSPLFLRYYPR